MRFMVTGGAGFIGANLVTELLGKDHEVINVDVLSYAGNPLVVERHCREPNYIFEKVDICDSKALKTVFYKHKPDFVLHLAAESHVDKSIDGPLAFIQTNIVGTFNLLNVATFYWKSIKCSIKSEAFRFVHVSTDEVYGDLGGGKAMFTEDMPYAPSSPYSATKASSDHLARAWHRTYGLPVIVTNCSNNYGPFQLPEKLVPLVISNCLRGVPVPIYGDGCQIRDWIYVQDHVRALMEVVVKGKVGETYNIGGNNELRNIEVVSKIFTILDELVTLRSSGFDSCGFSIKYVGDRPGHDIRYAIDSTKLKNETGWTPIVSFESGIRKTVRWYLDNQGWFDSKDSSDSRISEVEEAELSEVG